MEPLTYLTTRHDPAFVVASLIVAVFASYVTLDLARRVGRNGSYRRLWWLGGALAMGTGVWSMHFVGMLGFETGLPLAYRPLPTFVSWLAAVAAAGIAFEIAARPRLSAGMLVIGSAVMAAGICSMHYLGMAAVDLAPGIVWNIPMVIASIAVAWIASAAALVIFFMLRAQSGKRRMRLQAICSLVMGAAIGGMHYTGMMAANVPIDSVCLSTNGLSGPPLAVLVTVATLIILGGALLLSIIDAMSYARETKLTNSLHEANKDLREANSALQKMAFQDPLTGLPNRALLDDRLHHAVTRLAQTARSNLVSQERIAILFIDLDGFKPINDSFGHGVGDEVLCEIAKRLQQSIRDGDTLARLGGDEFVVMLERPDAQAAAITLAQRIIECLRRAFKVDGQELGISCSIGVAVYPDHDQSGSRLIGCADAAMYTAKRSGGGTCVVFDDSMAGDASEQLLLHQGLRHAIARGELMLYYQPKVTAIDGEIHGLEALIRWQHPERGLITPGVFIPLAERFGLIGVIGKWVIDEACTQLARWHAEGLDCRVAINLSPYQLRNPELPSQIENALNKNSICPDRLVVEITETALMENLNAENDVMKKIAALGVRLSIDDFGTGYSSLAHLRNIPARQLKIDRTFVADLANGPDARAILEAIVQLAHALRMEVVAEGVETSSQQAALTSLGCDVLQGYFIARPMPAASVRNWLKTSAFSKKSFFTN